MMSKTLYKKRLDLLTPQKIKKPVDRGEMEIIELLAELAAEDVISAETMATIRAKQGEKVFDPYGCLNDKELHCLCYLSSPDKRDGAKKRVHDFLWRNLRDLEIEDIDKLDKLIDMYK